MTSRRGAVMVYAIIMMTAFCAICSLAVDYGHVQLVKTELQRCADATARGYMEYYNVQLAAGASQTYAEAYANTHGPSLYSSSNNPVDANWGVSPTVSVTWGYWNTTTHTFSTSSSSNSNPAIQVKMSRTAANSNAVPLTWAAVIGCKSIDVHATAVAMLVPPATESDYVAATGNPFLAGMPAGSEASDTNPNHSPDFAGTNGADQNTPVSPTNSGLSITSGQVVNFSYDTSTSNPDGDLATNAPGLYLNTPDGEDGDSSAPSDIGHNNLSTSESGDYTTGYNNENGIADATIPINALVGVFLGPNQPSDSAAPSTNLDFSTDDSRNFTTLQPALQQIFFIGTGVNSNGQTQNFVAPQGATRLYIATWDFYQWNNNVGGYNINVTATGTVQLVQ